MRRVSLLSASMLVLASAAGSTGATLSEAAEELEALVVAHTAGLDELDAQLSGTTDLDDTAAHDR